MEAPLARYIAALDYGEGDYLEAEGFGPHDPAWRVEDTATGAVIERGFRTEDAAVGYAEALNQWSLDP
jgi:hypothetical protein